MNVFQRNALIVAVSVVVCGMVFVLGLLWLLPLRSHFLRLQHKRVSYYTQLAAACDWVLALHPVSTNEIVSVSVTDPSLPGSIQDLHPLELRVSPHRVWMLLDSNSRAGIGLVWGPKSDDTNVWVLYEVAENYEVDLYSVSRK